MPTVYFLKLFYFKKFKYSTCLQFYTCLFFFIKSINHNTVPAWLIDWLYAWCAGWSRWAAAGAGSVPDEGAPAGQVRPPGPGHQAEAAGRLLFFFLIFFGLHKNHPKSAKHCRYFCFVSKLKTFYNQMALFLNFLKILYNLSLDFRRMRETNFQFSFLKEELFYMS